MGPGLKTKKMGTAQKVQVFCLVFMIYFWDEELENRDGTSSTVLCAWAIDIKTAGFWKIQLHLFDLLNDHCEKTCPNEVLHVCYWLQQDLCDVVALYATERAFCALLAGGGVVCWGEANYGGRSPKILETREIEILQVEME